MGLRHWLTVGVVDYCEMVDAIVDDVLQVVNGAEGIRLHDLGWSIGTRKPYSPIIQGAEGIRPYDPGWSIRTRKPYSPTIQG